MSRNLNIVAAALAKAMSFDKPLHLWLDDGRELEGVPTHMEIDRNLEGHRNQYRGRNDWSNLLIKMPDGEAFHLMRVQRMRWSEGAPPR